MKKYDCIIIGAGHNGLVCGNYLSKAGLKVLILESTDSLGGVASTREVFEGYKISECAHIVNGFSEKVFSNLKLEQFGLSYAVKDIQTTSLSENGNHLTLPSNSSELINSFKEDGKALSILEKKLLRFAKSLSSINYAEPPRIKSGKIQDILAWAKLGLSIRSMGKSRMREFMRFFGLNIADELEENLTNSMLKGAIAHDAVLGSNLGPRSPGSLLLLILKLSISQSSSIFGNFSLPKGGIGSISKALYQSGISSGCEFRMNTIVKRILIKNNKAHGIVTNDGEEILGDIIVSNCDPKSTFFCLVGSHNLDTDFIRRVKNYRMKGNVSNINLALRTLPTINADSKIFSTRMLIAPNIDYIEEAFNHSKYGRLSDNLTIELICPTAFDKSLAPKGHQILSFNVQYTPYSQENKEAYDKKLLKNFFNLISKFMPDIQEKIIVKQVLSPATIEREYGLSGGQWHHGELEMDQMFLLRPVSGATQYSTPIEKLYLCGAGTHPGGGVTGICGHNAANKIKKDIKNGFKK